jgi:hypothetical protein
MVFPQVSPTIGGLRQTDDVVRSAHAREAVRPLSINHP